MKKFKVLIEGRNFVIEENNKCKKYGFFTTRFVQAEDAFHAETIALDLIRNELNNVVLNEQVDPPMLHVEAINEVASFGGNLVPGTGFSWYIEGLTGD